MSGHKLTIRGSGLSGRGYKVWLDDRPLTIQRLDLHMGIDDANVVDLRLLVNEVDAAGLDAVETEGSR